jgi:hypothetical protein
MTPEHLVSTWAARPFPGISDANHRWNPIASFITPGESVLIIGVGAGGLLQCLPSDCLVWGIELPSTLAYCGQDFTTYKPAFHHPNYTTLSLSWLMITDIEKAVDRTKMSNVAKGYDTVLIDVEGVSTAARLALRNEIAAQGPKCWVRCFDSAENIISIHRSVCSIGLRGDYSWAPSIMGGTELILGCSEQPLGTYTAHGECIPESNSACLDTHHSGSKILSKKMCCLTLGIDPTSSDEDITRFLYSERNAAKSLIRELLDFENGDSSVLLRVGRFKLRAVEFLSRYTVW